MFLNEIKIIEFIQQIRTPLLDEFFKFLNYFDTEIFYFILIPLIWIGYNWRLGVKLFFIIMLSAIVNCLLKDLFMLARPYQIEPTLGILQVKGYSMPSGAAQSAVLIPLVFINHFKKQKWPIIIGSIYFFFLSLSRMYLGVHFLSDILAGWIVGFLLFLIYLFAFPKIEKAIVKMGSSMAFWVSQSSVLVLLFVPSLARFAFTFLAVIIGLYLSKHFNRFLPNCKKFGEFLLRSVIAILGIFLIFFAFLYIFKKMTFWEISIMSYFQGLWISIGASYVYILLFPKKIKRTK